jgi:hypothetical protein
MLGADGKDEARLFPKSPSGRTPNPRGIIMAATLKMTPEDKIEAKRNSDMILATGGHVVWRLFKWWLAAIVVITLLTWLPAIIALTFAD